MALSVLDMFSVGLGPLVIAYGRTHASRSPIRLHTCVMR